jgi:Mn-containing catalase
MLAFMIARDTMHQNQWLAAIEELEADGLEMTPVPSNFPRNLEDQRVAYQFWNCSEGTDSEGGRWARGPSPDGKGEFQYLANPVPMSTDDGRLDQVDPRVYGTPKMPVMPAAAE